MKSVTLLGVCLYASFHMCALDIEQEFRKLGFIDIAELNPEVRVELMYAGDDNFTGRVLYEGFTRAWLHPDAAHAVDVAQGYLAEIMPGYHLLIKDAARPMSVQRKMFDAVKGTPKANYVANPAKGGGLHNYGLAVDITIVDPNGKELDMGTPVDFLGPQSNIDREVTLVKNGVMSENARQNRLLLRKIMKKAGFMPLRTEWWHFNLVSKKQAQESYNRLDF
ncbi:M15 family metallopeptidase [uncultured Duncaniella sp.]|uniref:M15 family metallopeptidase n=1 Tax=uncultured Duncaniella sp. TaxID=2768039 RepID=UPI0025E5B0C3|nr:M15 family metallopeptidase [uncultured Duncaniella sp.]